MDKRRDYGTSDHPMTADELRQAIEQPLADDEQPEIRVLPPPQWMAQLDERTQTHVMFAQNYAAFYKHGAPGHLDLMTIAALAHFLNNYEDHGSPWPQ